MKNDVQFIWGPKECVAFAELQSQLLSPPVLGLFDEDADTEVCDNIFLVGKSQ